MESFRLAVCLARIPRLFAALFFLPCLLSIVLIYTQLLTTEFLVRAVKRDPTRVKQQISESRDNSLLRRVLLNADGPLEPIKVCRWTQNAIPCPFDYYDVALQVKDPALFDPTPYVELLTGHFRRLHICTDCKTALVIQLTSDVPSVHAYSVWSLALLSSVDFSGESIERYFELLDRYQEVSSLIGERYLHAAGFQQPVSVHDLAEALGIIANIAMIIVIALWLAVRAHRKILDYFARSGALLPLVAATGKQQFYGALWFLTSLRVFIFLISAIPLCLIIMGRLADRSLKALLFHDDLAAVFLWLLTLTISLALAALVTSIADLRHRYSLVSVLYRYVPLAITLLGGVLWGVSFLFPDHLVHPYRITLSARPLAGITPTLLAPIFTLEYGVLVVHALLSCILLVVVGRANVRWFAAHLEDL